MFSNKRIGIAIVVFLLCFSTPISARASRWVDENSDAYNQIYGEASNVEGGEEKEIAKRKPGFFEENFADFFSGLATDLNHIFTNWNIDMSVDGIIEGRLSHRNHIRIKADFTHFGLETNNPWGIAGSIFYYVFRRIVVILLIVVILGLLIKQLFKNTNRGRAELKELCQYTVIVFILLFLSPHLLDLGIYAKDAVLYNVKAGVNYLTTSVLGSEGDSIKEFVVSESNYNSNKVGYVRWFDYYDMKGMNRDNITEQDLRSQPFPVDLVNGEYIYEIPLDLLALWKTKDGEYVCSNEYFPNCPSEVREVTYLVRKPTSSYDWGTEYYFYYKENEVASNASTVAMFGRAQKLYENDPTFINSLMMLCASGTGVCFMSYYVLIALLLTICFGFFPVLLIFGFFNKRILSGWMNIVVPCILTQIIDFMLVRVPIILCDVYCHIFGSGGLPLLMIVLVCYWSIVPVRGRVLKLIGFEPILSRNGGLFAAGMLLMRASSAFGSSRIHSGRAEGTAHGSSGGTSGGAPGGGAGSLGPNASPRGSSRVGFGSYTSGGNRGDDEGGLFTGGRKFPIDEQEWLDTRQSEIGESAKGIRSYGGIENYSAEDERFFSRPNVGNEESQRYSNLLELNSTRTALAQNEKELSAASDKHQELQRIQGELENGNNLSMTRRTELEERQTALRDELKDVDFSDLREKNRDLRSDISQRELVEGQYAVSHSMVGMDGRQYHSADEYRQSMELQHIRKMQMDYKNFDSRAYQGILSPKERTQYERERALSNRNRYFASRVAHTAVGLGTATMAATSAVAGAALGAGGGASASSSAAAVGAMGAVGIAGVGRGLVIQGKDDIAMLRSIPGTPDRAPVDAYLQHMQGGISDQDFRAKAFETRVRSQDARAGSFSAQGGIGDQDSRAKAFETRVRN